MTHWVLIVIIFSGSGLTSDSEVKEVVFESGVACKQAKAWIEGQAKFIDMVRATCIEDKRPTAINLLATKE